MDFSYYVDKIFTIFSSNCKRKKEDFVIKTETQTKKTRRTITSDLENNLKEENFYYKTPPVKNFEYVSQNESNRLKSISFCERLFRENDYGIYSQKKAHYKSDDEDKNVFLRNNNHLMDPNNNFVSQSQDYNPKVLNNRNSDELFLVVQKFNGIVNDLNDLKLENSESSPHNNEMIPENLKKPKEDKILKEYIEYENIVKNYLLCKSKEEKSRFFPEISFEDFSKIKETWNKKGNLSIEIVKHDFIPEKLTLKNLQTLCKITWLNDEVINSYIRLILNDIGKYSNEKIRIFNTFFFAELERNYVAQNQNLSNPNKIMRIAKKFDVDIFCDLIFIPINVHNNHWISIEIDIRSNIVSYCDSFPKSEKDAMRFFKIVEKFLILLENNSNVANKKWKLCVADFPQQENMSDCGVFMLKGIHYRALKTQKMFTQTDIPYFRMLITIELIKGKLLNDV